MIDSKDSGHAVALLLLPLMLTGQMLDAQSRQNVIPLKNWVAPLYWQPSQAEREAAGALQAASPQLKFSANAVSTNALTFVAITPCRLVDTRGIAAGFNGIDLFSGPSIPGAGTLTIPVQSATEAVTNTTPAPCGVIPFSAQAYSFNLTVVPAAGGAVDYISIWPSGSPQPFVAALNDPQGAIVANTAIVPAGTPLGGVSVFNAGPATVDLIIDMNGYFTAPTDPAFNTAVGMGTLANNTTGNDNTASGSNALQSNTTGNDNTANGYQALGANTAGTENTANGFNALQSNTTGSFNTASGGGALFSNSTGNWNTASGASALMNNTTGLGNTTSGYQALMSNTTGNYNTVIGFQALQLNTSGGFNIAIGESAASNVSGTAINNIHIGSFGSFNDSGTIRIGNPGVHTSFFAAGIRGATTGAANAVPVMIDSNGQLGTVSSSQRFKEDIQDMGDSSSGLLRLRPVTFRYKEPYNDGSRPLDYGLIAEEVAQVYPDLAVTGADGQIETVQYQKLTPMLLNELQKQAEQNRQQAERIRSLEDRLAAVEAWLPALPSATPEPAR